jgi:DNA repair protein RecO (recombination protein O)
MLINTKAIVISSLKYQEKNLIVKCYTQSSGIKSYFVRNAFANKKSNQKIGYYQSLNILEIEANHKNKNTLEYINEVKIATPFHSVSTNIIKSSIVLFLSEILQHAIQEEEQNDALFTFLETALIWLDTHEEIANFHLVFLVQLTKFLGFYPEMTTIENEYFEMIEGRFLPYITASSLNLQSSLLLKVLFQLKFDDARKMFTAQERQQLLEFLIDYYALHLDSFKKPKSHEILKEVFN